MQHRTLAALVGGALLAAIALGAWTSSSSGAEVEPPEVAAIFELTVDGVKLGFFSDVEGLTASSYDVEGIEVLSRGTGVELKLPPTRRPPSITLRRGATSSLELWAWHEAARQGVAGARKDVDVVMYSSTLTPVARWAFQNAWPSKVTVGSTSGEPPLEVVTIVADSVRRTAP